MKRLVLLLFLASCSGGGSDTPPPPPPPPPPAVCVWDDTILDNSPECVEPVCIWDDTLVESDPLCFEPVCPWDDNLVQSNPLCVEPRCPWDDSLVDSDPACVVCSWDDTILKGDPACVEPDCIWNPELKEGDIGCVPCTITATWVAPTKYEDCAVENLPFCGTLLPEGYLKQFDIYLFVDKLEPPIIQVIVPNPGIVLWEITDLQQDDYWIKMTASGYPTDREPNPDTGIIELSTSRYTDWKTKACF